MKKNYLTLVLLSLFVYSLNSQTIVSTDSENRKAVVEELTEYIVGLVLMGIEFLMMQKLLILVKFLRLSLILEALLGIVQPQVAIILILSGIMVNMNP